MEVQSRFFAYSKIQRSAVNNLLDMKIQPISFLNRGKCYKA